MLRRALVILPFLAATATAHADDLYQCKRLAPDAKVRVNLAPGTKLADAVTWVAGFTCKNIVYPTDLAVRVTIVSPNDLTAKQAYQLFLDTLPVYGVAATEHGDNLILTASSSPPEDPELATNVKHIDDEHATITRVYLDKLLGAPGSLAQAARVVPSIKDGKPNGFKLYAIRPNSIWARLGFQNGDTVLAVNGHEMTTADKALEVYALIKNDTAFRIDLLRRGSPATLEIKIVEGK